MQLKVYVVYPQPWWLTDLGIEHGLFTSVETNPPFVGRYHDGPISRTVSIDGDVSVGQAALEVVYTFSLQYESIDYYSQFREFYKHFVGSEYKGNATAVDPLTVSEDSALLEAVHGKLMAMHVDLFEQKGKSASDVGMPTSVVFGFWDLDESTLLPTPLSSNFAAQFPTCQVETCLDSISPHDYFTTTAFPAEDLYIANNDFYYTLYQDTPCCWAQQSLKVAERILHDKFGAPQPSWLDGEYYETAVMAL
ncbi:hypothetical protein M885DRAFT_173478 [Pelagophyceae sp. CCMP2097]|nr:hypothetical protein M885DRAFT_173478 [Pelagophyceae sp. CCMP2097]